MADNRPELFLLTTLARKLHSDPRVDSLKHAEPIAWLVTGGNRKLPLFSAAKIEFHTQKKDE